MKVYANMMVCLSLFFFSEIYGQPDITRDRVAFDQIIENLFPIQEEDANYTALYDRLFSLYLEPIDLNKTSAQELHGLYFLSDLQIHNFLEYRKQFGKLYSVFELNAIASFDPETINKITPFVTVVSDQYKNLRFGKSLRYSQVNQLIIGYNQDLEKKKGYMVPDTLNGNRLTSRYAGSPARYSLRWNYSLDGYYSLGLVMEKDPGEQMTWNPATHQYGMDYYAFHAMIEDRGIVKRFIAGSYSLDCGQGLILGSGLWIGKGAESINTVRRANMGLRPYKSVYEYKDFTGMAITMGGNNLMFTGFYSQQNRDASLHNENNTIFVSSIQTSGLHRTPTEIDAKSSENERSFGMNLNFLSNADRINLGMTTIFTHFKLPVIPTLNNYNQYYFTGQSNYAGSLYGSYVLKNINVFGEAGFSKGGGSGAIAGLVMSITSSVQSALLWRNYSKDFHAMHSMAFRENSQTNNESGIYWGLKVEPFTKLKLNFFLDSFRFPWLKYRVDAPSQGSEIMFSGEFDANQSLICRWQFRQKRKDIDFNGAEDPLNKVMNGKKQYLKFQLVFQPEGVISLNTRIQFSKYHIAEKPTSGFLMAQDVNIHKHSWYITGRFALFDTDDYDNRQFIYENDVLYAYSVPFFQGVGSRIYMLGKFDINKHISFWAKYAKTIIQNVNIIGSGLEEITGNEKSNLSALVRYKF